MTMRYREATKDDAAAIAHLHAESWRITYRGAYPDEYLDGPVRDDRLAVWTKRFSDPPPEQYVVVAEDGVELAGFGCVYGAKDDRWGSYLDNLHTAPARHREGIGTGLIADITQWCCEHHAEHGLYLSVHETNTSARRFYERLGATDRGGETVVSSSGSLVAVRRYAWDALDDLIQDGTELRST